MDVEDALELLSPSFTHPVVRGYAITRLKQAPDDDLVLYLLQLVQALKYENFDDIEVSSFTLITASIPNPKHSRLFCRMHISAWHPKVM